MGSETTFPAPYVEAGPPANPVEEKVRELAGAALADGTVDYVIGWRYGYDTSQVIPAFVRDAAEVDQLVVNPLVHHNLVTFLKRKMPDPPNAKIGICVKGCDSRTLVALLQEELVDKERIHVIGVPCTGTIERRRIEKLFSDELVGLEFPDADTIVATSRSGETQQLAKEDYLRSQCTVCRYPNPRYADELARDEVTPRLEGEPQWPKIEEFEAMSPADKDATLEKVFATCIRCFACIHACPVCWCWDQCVCRSRRPALVGQKVEPKENLLFQMIHMFHVAGRCPSCGACDQACPVEIPLYLLHRKMNKELHDMLGFEAGVTLEGKPVFQTFDLNDPFGQH